ncbi:KpsF/GutQ family sugar-phosphate isomerase [Desulfovibrio sp. OttesenSCG-928-G15]|nr:KpsF/GutQ family sugar-phosphate isomerase [Desulfovibrio sp. OttesenSCG-928-G15]
MQHDWIQRGREILAIECEGLQAVREHIDESFARAVELLAACKGRVVVTGIGKSGLVGRKIAATLSSTGTPAYFLHPVEGAHGDLGVVSAQDVVIAISYSGKTDELTAILPALRRIGTSVIALTSGLASPLAALSDIVINAAVPREACGMNLVPTSSTTATLALGDALAVCLMDHKSFGTKDFRRNHPGGDLGQRLGLQVADIMHTGNIPVARENAPLGVALSVLDKSGFGAVVLTDAENLLTGILVDGDVRRLLCRGGANMDKPVSSVMTKRPAYASPEMSAAELMNMMEEKGITVLPVADKTGKVTGIVHLHDILGKGKIRFSGPGGV